MQQKHSTIILAIVWPIGSGKGTATSFLERRYGARAFKSSGPLRQILHILNRDITRENMQKLSQVLRENFWQDTIANIAKREILSEASRISIIDGARRRSDILPFEDEKNFFLIYIDADLETRYSRIVKRAENGGDNEKTFEQFKIEESSEAESQTKDLRSYAHFVVDNSSNESEFTGCIEAIIQEILS
jgi:dephospho-CoA kinase